MYLNTAMDMPTEHVMYTTADLECCEEEPDVVSGVAQW